MNPARCLATFLVRIFVAGVSAAVPAFAATSHEPHPLTGLTHYPECRYVEAPWNDGDSFLVELPTGEQVTVRLYEADCIEKHVSDESQARRLRAQRRYFGISDYGGSPESSIAKAKELGEAADQFTRNALDKPFSIHTSHADARGAPGNDRIYAFVFTSDNRSLAAELVRNGLARAHGVYRRTPDDLHRDEAEERMEDLELLAAGSRRGVWAFTDWEALPEERMVERLGDPELRASIDRPPAVTEADPINVNTAPSAELERLPGVGPVIAGRIIEERERSPFQSAGDLGRVRGIGPESIETIAPFIRFE
ncbi:MAG: helix-hairpin-helix domain-containing protein [Puniceicoccaceae bacterium]